MQTITTFTQNFYKGVIEYPYQKVLAHFFWILVTFILTIIFIKVSSKVIDKLFKYSRAESNQAKTLRKLIKSITKYTIWAVALLTIMIELGFNPTTVIAGASIFGLALGVGAQSLIKDIITGFFLIFERQLEVGDFTRINDQVEGIVEEVGLRITKVREANGSLHYLPNGTIGHVTNYNRDNMKAIIPITLPFETDVDLAISVLNEVAESIYSTNKAILEKPEVMGVTNIDQTGIQLAVHALTVPEEYWRVAREIRKKAVVALQKAGINIAYPRSMLYHADLQPKYSSENHD